ncbi:hypothetical protein F2Q68_00010373 [Brassica cretica]|uniref:Uncharacterized protein n=1 Tax=Brassica cretica TaxID=69181 RepID=A0A8S9KTM8_BRACR|nr:hypothetical protein F2Q68_00010373 [Brassica cretica]
MESGTSDSTFSVDDRDTWMSRRRSERGMLTKMPSGRILDEPAVVKIEMQWSRAWRQRICWVRCSDRINPDRILKDQLESGSSLSVCTGYGIEPSLDGSVLTGPRLVLDGGLVLLTGCGAVEPSM